MATVYDDMTVPEIRQHARANAEGVLESYWDGKLPVDPIKLALDLGVEVYTAQLGNDVYGMISGTAAEAKIFLDADQVPVRLRFTCAHELGHYIERSSSLDDEAFARIDRRSTSGHGQPIEVFANEFAASLLMPEAEVKRLHGQNLSVYAMAAKFDVSVDAMTWRKHHLNIK